MTRRWTFAAVLAGLLLGGGLSLAHAVELHSVPFPERREVDLRLRAEPRAPKAQVELEVTYRDGQARIVAQYDNMKPAILFAGDVTCYVMWAVSRDGHAENLGEFLAAEPKGKLEFATAQKAFALLVTAEPFYLVRKPSELVMFTNYPSREKRAPSTPFQFTNFAPAPKHALDSIADIRWDSTTPLALLQARKAYELATRNEAKTHAAEIYQEAGVALAEANQLADKSPGSRKVLDLARRAVALSNEAINIALHRIEGIELERRIAERRREMEALETRADAAEARARSAEESATEAERNARMAQEMVTAARTDIERLQKEKTQMAAETAALRDEKARLESGMVALRQEKRTLEEEKSDLKQRLSAALSHVAETRDTARGFVVNLPDILFDVDKATLKPYAQLVLAKMAGILLVIPDLQVTVEGHTDSTGSEEYNLQLSQRRAEAVQSFLSGEGVAAERIRAVGFGMTRPVADNATAEGRSKNRRVEIVIGQPQTG